MSSPVAARKKSDAGADEHGHSINDIPRRLMRVKVLYTFDDQNKSNCLARLPNALNIPTVSLDDNTQLGVIDLRTCIQAIVLASPELVAKLGHDYTVYAYDYSEYETPLVGQGMLSWILASASMTPNAPAEQSQTMVTGRVCNNILGLFSNGIKETLEVKLKLIPVPTCLQEEYIENMERYHSLSRLVPEGLDYKAWADFLKDNPALGHLAQPAVGATAQSMQRQRVGGMEAIHDMLTPQPSHSEEHSFPGQALMPYNAYDTRPSSPAMSTASYNQYQDSRPPSRASIRNDTNTPTHSFNSCSGVLSISQEEGPPKKRARVTKATRPKKAKLGTNKDSLRVTASTAASVRLHRPVGTTPAVEMASMEQVPRAPTPRPGDRVLPQARNLPRLPAPSFLRHASVDEGRPHQSPYDSPVFSDNAVESADDERGNSPGDTPMNIPSSPPVMLQRQVSSAPSSPGLPALPFPADSGFVSDMPLAMEEQETESVERAWEGSDLPSPSNTRKRARRGSSQHVWRKSVERMESLAEEVPTHLSGENLMSNTQMGDKRNVTAVSINSRAPHPTAFTDLPDGQSKPDTDHGTKENQNQVHDVSQGTLGQMRQIQHPQQIHATNGPPGATVPTLPMGSSNDSIQTLGPGTIPNPLPRGSYKFRGLSRSHTWSGEPMSDPVGSEASSRSSRSRHPATQRKKTITDALEQSLAFGVLPKYCHNCGEIETPTWRKVYTRMENGSPEGLDLSTDGLTGIMKYEVMEPLDQDEDKTETYKIFKMTLGATEWERGWEKPKKRAEKRVEKDGAPYDVIWLCNPCGLWFSKKRAMRPREIWEKQPIPEGKKPKRKRYPKKKTQVTKEEIHSDAPMPHSEPVTHTGNGQVPAFTGGSQMDDATAVAALQRAIQSSPAARRGSKDSPIELEPDVTPRPTRRLLFPSPRSAGEVKFLSDCRSSTSPKSELPELPEPDMRLPDLEAEDTNKENCPPGASYNEDDLAHLFEEHGTPKTTPTKGPSLPDLLKTPTPGSRRSALTPKRGAENSADLVGLTTPSRNMLTPSRGGRATTMAPETPFTRQLNALLSDAMEGPCQAIDFPDFPTFNTTPGRSSGAQFTSFNMHDDFLSSDLPIPSSSPGGLGFSLWEDPATSTVGLWSGVSVFEGSDATVVGEHQQQETEQQSSVVKTTEISVDFAAMIEGVVSNADQVENRMEGTVSNTNKEMDNKDASSPQEQVDGAGDTKRTGDAGDVRERMVAQTAGSVENKPATEQTAKMLAI